MRQHCTKMCMNKVIIRTEVSSEETYRDQTGGKTPNSSQGGSHRKGLSQRPEMSCVGFVTIPLTPLLCHF